MKEVIWSLLPEKKPKRYNLWKFYSNLKNPMTPQRKKVQSSASIRKKTVDPFLDILATNPGPDDRQPGIPLMIYIYAGSGWSTIRNGSSGFHPDRSTRIL
jgi:hypothetical protein